MRFFDHGNLSEHFGGLTLGKQYRQDQALDWGFLTAPEQSHRERKAAEKSERKTGSSRDEEA